MKRLLPLLPLALFLSPPTLAVDVLDTAENILYRPGDRTRMGIEVELKGLSLDEIAREIQAQVGGQIGKEVEMVKTTLKGKGPDGLPEYNYAPIENLIVKGTSIGDVVIKPDYNQVGDDLVLKAEDPVAEIVTEPIRMPEVEKLERILARLKAKGGIGTKPGNMPVATQVNLEFAEGNREKMNPEDLVNLMRSYLRPEHREQVEEHLAVPRIRRKYLKPLSEGFMARLIDPDYSPSWREFYDDYVYRQSLEFLGYKDAWKMPIEKARAVLLAEKDPVVTTVVKLNPLRVSSLLMFLFPDDPMSKLYHATGWAKARPLVEFREWNNDFTIVSPAKQALGLMEGAKRHGYYDHDRLLASVSTMDEAAIRELRAAVNKQGREGQTVFRYFLGDPKSVNRLDYAEQATYYKVGKVGFLPFGSYGEAPVVIPGESVVYHRRPMHRFSVMGKYNPGLINFNLQQALENKFAEAKFWDKYAPGSIPETRSLEEFPEVKDPAKLLERLNREFPGGWVMKGIWDLGSEKDIITDKTDVVGALKNYDAAAFAKRKAALEKKFASLADAAPEWLQTELKADPAYKGYKISRLLSKPELVIIQRKVAIKREFRVEVMAGRVLGNGTTLDRYKYMYEAGTNGLKMKDYVAPKAADIRGVEAWAQAQIDKLPAELRGTPFGMDIAQLEGGGFAMIESNPGGNSNFLFEEYAESVVEHGKFLKRYPEMVKTGEIGEQVSQGLTAESQMKFLSGFFREFKIDPKRQYPGIEFLADRLEDPEFSRVRAEPAQYRVRSERSGARARKAVRGSRCMDIAGQLGASVR